MKVKKVALAFTMALMLLLPSLLLIFSVVTVAGDNLSVHNIETGLNYATIQEAINAQETLDGHTIVVNTGIYHEHVVVNKSLILVGETSETTIIDGSGTGTVVRVTVDNISISRFTIQNSGSKWPNSGIYAQNSENCNVSRNVITNNYCGIILFNSSDNNLVHSNRIIDNHYGVGLYYSSENMVYNNTITDNYYGVWLDFALKTIVYNNKITNNTFGIGIEYCSNNNMVYKNKITNNTFGIRLKYSSNNNAISKNKITNNFYGCWLDESSNNNTICKNKITNNTFGIGLFNSSDNEILHNNFVDNSYQTQVSPLHSNTWDSGREGNFWSNYNEEDENRNGIGDTPYVIDEYNQDTYPLMGMFSDFNTSLGYYVYTICNSTISDFHFDQANHTLSFNVNNEEGIGFCRICIPHDLMEPPYVVVVDKQPPQYANYTLFDNDTHRWIYFTYPHLTHEVIIIPEFPSIIILPSAMISTLIATITIKKYRRKE